MIGRETRMLLKHYLEQGASKSALHVTGGKFTLWGVTLGAELADAGCYDASAYAGVEASRRS